MSRGAKSATKKSEVKKGALATVNSFVRTRQWIFIVQEDTSVYASQSTRKEMSVVSG